jgi:anhydro-N-acetylmuramic acid kinase
VLHKPAAQLTVQIGNGAALARRLQLPVAYDFRAADVAASGEDAPLVPMFHQALARDLAHAHPIAVLNLGGRRQRHFRRWRQSGRLRHRSGQRAD